MPRKPRVVTEPKYGDEVARWLNLGPYKVTSWPMRIVATGEWVTYYGVSEGGVNMGMSCQYEAQSFAAAEMMAAALNRIKWEGVQMHNRLVGAGKPFAQTSGWLKRRGTKFVRDLKRGVPRDR